MRLLVVALVAGMMATGGFLVLQIDQPALGAGSEERVVAVGGGTVTHAPALQGGERFLKQVALPEHLTNPYKPDAANEVPGDGHDDDLLVTQRRETDHSWWTKPVTGRVEIFNVHGTPTNPVCICDVEFVLSNETEDIPGVFVWIRYSSHVLVDNVTVYGGQLAIDDSHNITVSRSQFWNAFIGTFNSVTSDVLIWDNDFSQAEGPFAAIRTDPITYNPTGIDECWPNPSCVGTGVGRFSTSFRWTIMWNYFEAGGATAFNFNYWDFHIEHNTFMNSPGIWAGFGGHNYVGWNLMRGFGNGGIEIGGTTALVENNSLVLNGELYPLREIYLQEPGVTIWNGCICTVRDNDFVGFGSRLPNSPAGPLGGGSPALANLYGHAIANDNYWGTVFDPTIAGDQIVRTYADATTILDTWRTEPLHPLKPIAYPLNDQDAERWLDEAPRRIPRTQEHLNQWVEDGCQFSGFSLCAVPPAAKDQ